MAAASTPARTARREATRARLLAAASDAFAERGFYGASVEEICERAGFTRGAFYSNFASREELVIELAEQRSTVVRDRVRELTASGGEVTPTALLHGVLDLWGDDAEARHRWLLLQNEFTLHALRDPAAGEAWAAHLDRATAETAEVLRAYQASTGIELPVSADDLARLLFAVFLAGATQHLLSPGVVAENQLEEAFVGLVEHAIARRP